jgi:UDPglucose 6-dehydrogenase
MKITIVGTGYVGLVTAACLAEQGNSVLCLDLNSERIKELRSGVLPIYEQGLRELFERNTATGRLDFTDDIALSVGHGEIQFVAVGTPPGESGAADLRHVMAAASNIGRHMTSPKIIVSKSTVPVGTGENIRAIVQSMLIERHVPNLGFAVVSNPEFLKEGAAVSDFMRPDRIVIGVDGADAAAEHARVTLRALYAPFNRNHDRLLFMDVRSAEFTKYAANAMLATRISFMNELANLADAVGVDIEMVRQGIGSDSRIGYSFLYAGTGYGGSCFPKDVKALQATAAENGMSLAILEAVEAVNRRQKLILAEKIIDRFGGSLSGRCFAVWGLSFKPETDDMREAPSRDIIRALINAGAKIRAYDPVAMSEARKVLAQDLSHDAGAMKMIAFCGSPTDALSQADALVIATEWKVFRGPDFPTLKKALRHPIIFDGRNLYDPAFMREQNIEYHPIGRGSKPKIHW